MGESIEVKEIVVSAINFFEGGPLSILNDCISELQNEKYASFNIKLLVHKTELIKILLKPNVELIELPKSRISYFYRFYYEYFYFYRISKKWKVKLWLSLHDMSPVVKAENQSVYCHNPSIFRKATSKDLFLQPKVFFFTLFYKFLYRINIHSNRYIIVQSLWMKNAFSDLYTLPASQIIVSQPDITISKVERINSSTYSVFKSFFYPALPRTFKNIEIICEACAILNKKGITNFKVVLTIDGSENSYSKSVFNKFSYLPCIDFIGLKTRSEVFELYEKCDVLIFPSTLETWGLPITEFKSFNKPIILIDLPYAHETLGNYDKVNFFDSKNEIQLANLILNHIEENVSYNSNSQVNIPQPSASSWKELFEILLE